MKIDLGRVVGKSAYEIALDNGFVGTEQEWLDSISGTNYDDTELKELINEKADISHSHENYVEKEGGKGLSTNDFTDEDKEKLDELNNYDDTEIKNQINNKSDKDHSHSNYVEKVSGKGLSTNDYTTAEKNKLAGLNNYDDSEVKELISGKSDSNHTHSNYVEKVSGKGLSTNDFTNTYKTKLDGLSNYDDTSVKNSINTINSKIPAQASSTNQLADKDFVNSSIATATSEFVGTFNSLNELKATTKTYDNNDYAFVVGKDSAGNTQYSRYKWNGSSWIFEYVLNNSSFTSEQWKAINSNVTDEWRQSVNTSISNKVDKVSGKGLSTNDYTTAEKNKLANLENYDDSALKSLINGKADINGSTADFQANNHFYKSLGTWKDYEQVVIPILEITASTTANRYSNGKIFSHRDNGLYANPIVEWKCNKMYNATASEKYNLVAYKLNHFKFATFEYDGKKYLGVLWNWQPAQPLYCYFDGYTNNNVSPMFTVIPYYNSNTKVVLNEEIKNSLIEITSYDYGALATKSVADKNGNDITTTYATKTELSGKAAATHNHDSAYAAKSHTHSNKTNYNWATMVGLGFTKDSYVSVRDFWAKLVDTYGFNGVVQFDWANANQAYIGTTSTNVALNGGTLIYTAKSAPSAWSDFSAIYYQGGSGNNVYHIRASIGNDATVGKEGWGISRLTKEADLDYWKIANTNYDGNPNDCSIGKWYSINTNENKTNVPAVNGWATIITFAANNNTNYKQQLCLYSNGGDLYSRTHINGTWGSWTKFVKQSDLDSYSKTDHTHSEFNKLKFINSIQLIKSDGTTNTFYYLIAKTPSSEVTFNVDTIFINGSDYANRMFEGTIRTRSSNTVYNYGRNDLPLEFYSQTDGTINIYWKVSDAYNKVALNISSTQNMTIYSGDISNTTPTGTKMTFSNYDYKAVGNMNIKNFGSPAGTTRYVEVSSAENFAGVEVNIAYSGKWYFSQPGSVPLYLGNNGDTYGNYGLTGYAWGTENKKLYLRFTGYRGVSVSVLGATTNIVSISDWTTTAPTLPSGVSWSTNEYDIKAKIDGKASTSHNHDSAYAAKSHTHDDRYYTESEIDTKLNSNVTSNNLINALGTGDSVPIDGDYFISQYAGGSNQPNTNTSKNNFYRRPISTLWSYIKSKIEATRLSHSKGITISNTTDVTLSSFGAEGLSIGTSAGTNIGIDNNEIQARNNGAASPLYINANGGAVYFGAGDKYCISSDGSSYNGIASKATADGNGSNIASTYATKTELNGKANSSHNHDDRYYTETEINTNVIGKTKSTGVDLSGKSASNFYPVIITGRDRTAFKEVMITSTGGSSSIAYNQNRIHFTIANDGWNDTPKSFFIKEYACYVNNEITIGCIGYGNKGSQNACVWLRGGRTYTVYTRDCSISYTGADIIENANDSNYSKFTVGTNYYGGTNTNVDIVFTPQSTITNGLYSNRAITAPSFVGLASKATADASGNNIANTYATKTELSGKANTSHTHSEYATKVDFGAMIIPPYTDLNDLTTDGRYYYSGDMSQIVNFPNNSSIPNAVKTMPFYLDVMGQTQIFYSLSLDLIIAPNDGVWSGIWRRTLSGGGNSAGPYWTGWIRADGRLAVYPADANDTPTQEGVMYIQKVE